MKAHATGRSKTRTACDRCYELKERCQRASVAAHCARCDRLGLLCSTVRPVKPSGRRAHRVTTTGKGTQVQGHPQSIQTCLDALPSLEQEEKELLMALLSKPGDLDQYVASPRFQTGQQRAFSTLIHAALPSLSDALLACALSMQHLQTGITTEIDTTPAIQYITKAMNTLRSMPVFSAQDAALCHALGGLLAFSISSTIGVGIPDICRHCLGTTTPLLKTTESDAQEDPWRSFLVLLDIMDCLVYRQKPILRIEAPSTAIIDCRLGLCLPLLPYYQDICVISNSLLNTTDTMTLSHLQKQLDDICHVVEPWQPTCLDDLADRYDATEIVYLLAQAKVYRLGALLLGHRLKHPFGREDEQAEVWSKEIMMELEMAKRVTKQSIKFVTLPFIIAAVEARDQIHRSKTLDLVDYCVDYFAQFLRKQTKTFLDRIWHERDFSLTSCWFDSVYKPCPVLDSINTSHVNLLD
ncbi:hypothetical protein GGR57DRAFT_385079 [Xylariaceae sp. FL1272]|nr:hypothetical protein GGR57DRAFT_385079 [Xylariaceae sp. FL1272]